MATIQDSYAILESRLHLKDGAFSLASLTSPAIAEPLAECPSNLTDVHAAYWNALKAHQQAKSKYETLKSELAAVASRHAPGSRDNTSSKAIAESYIPLLYQRETLRKLKIIDGAFTSLNKDDGNPAAVVLDDFIKARAGEMPLLPSTPNQHSNQASAADERTFELKKAVLAARRTVDDHNKANESTHMNGVDTHDAYDRIYALQQARNELITWIEEKLSIIGDAQAINTRPTESLAVAGDEEPIPISKAEIGQIYDQYLNARKSMLQTLQHPNSYALNHQSNSREDQHQSSAIRSHDESGAMAAALLPYIASLSAIKAREEETSQHGTFTEQQMKTAEEETAQLLRRLADESHLVQPGAKRGKDWAMASRASSDAVSEIVAPRLEAGLQGASEAEDVLVGLNRLPALLRTKYEHE